MPDPARAPTQSPPFAGSIRERIAALIRRPSPLAEFRSDRYVRHNQRRQEHLASLGLPLAGRRVLEVGAGIGDHTTFLLDRGCEVVITEPRPDNLRVLRRRFPDHPVHELDLDRPDPAFEVSAEVVYCYGTLYHLSEPESALAYLADRCEALLLLETCVAPGDKDELAVAAELSRSPSQALTGRGSRPTRAWLRSRLAQHFPHVYCTRTQPWHEEFPTDWTLDFSPEQTIRCVFVASREPLESPDLVDGIPERQTRH